MKVNTTKAKRCLKRLYRIVIIRTCHIWGTLLVLYLALLTPYLFKYFDADFWNPDFHLRISGFILQFLFVIVVLIDICEIMKFFDRPSPIQSLKKWLEDLYAVFVPQTYIIKADKISHKVKMGNASAYLTLGQKNLKIERRVEILEERLKGYIKQTNLEIQELKNDTNELLVDLKKEKRQREQDLKGVNEIIKKISTDGLKLEAAALLWLVAGLLFSIFSSELASILNWL